MNSELKRITLAAILLTVILLSAGCFETAKREFIKSFQTNPDVCYIDSEVETVKLRLSYECDEKEKEAQIAAKVCDLIAESAHLFVKTNRRIGPTSPQDIENESRDEIQSIEDKLNMVLGEAEARPYINQLQEMSYEVANRNVTDLIGFPENEYKLCVDKYGFKTTIIAAK